jgi:siroheme synthase (precorrin-2 oxidase/ferrochelatase)
VVYDEWNAMTGFDANLFPMMIKLASRRCVVIGAGKVAAAKIKGLIACGAQVIVVSPEAEPPVRALVFYAELFSACLVPNGWNVVTAKSNRLRKVIDF